MVFLQPCTVLLAWRRFAEGRMRMEHFTSDELSIIHAQILTRWYTMSHQEWEEDKDTMRKFLDYIEDTLSDRRVN